MQRRPIFSEHFIVHEADGAPVQPSQEQIAALAYSYWEARGKPIGSPCEDWFRAESDLRQRLAAGSFERFRTVVIK